MAFIQGFNLRVIWSHCHSKICLGNCQPGLHHSRQSKQNKQKWYFLNNVTKNQYMTSPKIMARSLLFGCGGKVGYQSTHCHCFARRIGSSCFKPRLKGGTNVSANAYLLLPVYICSSFNFYLVFIARSLISFNFLTNNRNIFFVLNTKIHWNTIKEQFNGWDNGRLSF